MHPLVIDAYLDGKLARHFNGRVERRHARGSGLLPEESAVIALLDHPVARQRAA